MSATLILLLPLALGYFVQPLHIGKVTGRGRNGPMTAPLCRGRWRLCQDDDLQRIMDELDDDDDDDDDDGMPSAAELAVASKLEQAILGQMSVRAAAEQSYLGAGEPLPCSTATTGAEIAAELSTSGVVRLSGALSEATAAELRQFIVVELETAKAVVAKQDAAAAAAKQALGIELPSSVEDGSFSKVLAPDGEAAAQSGSSPAKAARWDLRLPMAPIVRKALRELFGDDRCLGDAVSCVAGGSTAALWELAALISSPGAVAQVVHADTRWSGSPILFSAFVAVQPISRALGPTRFLPHTHTDEEAHAALESQGDVTGLASVSEGERPWRQRGSTDGSTPPRSFVALLQTGDVVVYDGRTFHCGGANRRSVDEGSDDTDGLRIIFYATFRHAGRLADAAAYDDPARRSILAEYAGRHTLGDVMQQTGAVAYTE